MTDALRNLIEAVEAGKFLMDVFPSGRHERIAYEAFGGSLDAAKSLHDELLPGWVFDVTTDSAFVCPQEYMSFDNIPDHIRQFSGENSIPARAWLLAILRAKLAEGE